MNECDVKCLASDLADRMIQQGHKGYDPYDALASPVFTVIDRIHPFLGRICIHGLKRLPVNPRPLLGIHRYVDAKALGLAACGFFRLGRILKRDEYCDEGVRCLDLITRSVTEVYSGACWGHPFPYRSSRAYLSPDFPTVVSTAYAVQALLDGYEVRQETEWLDLARSACQFVLSDLPRFGGSESFCFGYYPGADALVHNASLLAVQVLARVSKVTGDDSFVKEARGAVRYTLADQREDGAWYYDAPDSPSRSGSFIDGYHTGFVLESLHDIQMLTGWNEIEDPLKRGIDFYVENLFAADGQPVQRLGENVAVDLRDCAQALIVFSRLRNMLTASQQVLPDRVLEWTVRNMKTNNGFYRASSGCKKWFPAVEYVRFQSWMLRAFSEALEVLL